MLSREPFSQQSLPAFSDVALSASRSPLALETTQIEPSRAANSIVFVDSTVRDYRSLISGVRDRTEVHILNSSQDAVTQITQTLLGRSEISSVHILSHGAAGGLRLGNHWLSADILNHSSGEPQSNPYTNQIRSWASTLTPNADLLLYGCDIAQGGVGEAFIQQLAQLTGADVAASDDLTGNVALGGNWALERHTGVIEASLAFDGATLSRYEHVLPVTIPGYSESLYVSGLPSVAALTTDLATGTLYLADSNTSGTLRKVTSDRIVSQVAANFATSSIYPYIATDIQFANGSVYTSLGNGQLIQINAATGSTANPATFSGFGIESGLATVGGNLYITSGKTNGTPGELREFNLSTGANSLKLGNLPTDASSLEFDPVKNKFYFARQGGGGIYSADLNTGVTSQISSISGNFAIDSTGEFLYVRGGSEVMRVSTTNGSTSTFQTGLSGNMGDVVFGRASSGTGGSLYVSDNDRILEVSGFTSPIASGSGGTGVYNRSLFAQLQNRATGLAYDQATRTLYFADHNGSGTLRKATADRTVSTVATNFTNGGFYPYAATDIQFANGAVYTVTINGNLVQINPTTGTATNVANFIGIGGEAGLALNAGKLLLTSGNGGSQELREYDPNTGMSTLRIANLPSGSSSLEYDSVKNKYYFFSQSNREFYVADLATNTYSQLTSPTGSAGFTTGNFAIDPNGDFLYTRAGTDILRISTTNGSTSVFQTGLSSNDFGSDLVFGVSSSGVGGSLYVGDEFSIVEISGFATPPFNPGTGSSVYNRSVYANTFSGDIAALTFDSTTRTLFFAEANGSGVLNKVNLDRTISTVATNFANGGFFPYAETDIQFFNGSVYASIDGGNLVQINAQSGISAVVTQSSNFGSESGLAIEAGKILISSGRGTTRELREYDPTTGSNRLKIGNLPDSPSSLEFDPVKDRYYYSANGQFFSIDASTGATNLVASVNNARNFAIDPNGEFLYTRSGSDIVRISTTSGITQVFQSGFDSTGSFTSDLVFGASSSGSGYSLYVGDRNQIIEISGFSTQPVNTAPSNSVIGLYGLDKYASESSVPVDRAMLELRRNNKIGSLVVKLEISPSSTASVNDYILSVDAGRISIVDSVVTVTIPDGLDTVYLNVRPVDDAQAETRETLFFNVKNAPEYTINGNGVEVSIEDNDQPEIAINNVSITEGNNGTAQALFTVTLSTASDLPVSVTYSTFDDSAFASEGDYSPLSNTLTFAPGETSKAITVNINGDTRVESNETFQIRLLNANNGILAANGSVGTATIVNDDEESSWEILGNADFNGDKTTDILWRNFKTGAVQIWQVGGSGYTKTNLTSVADFNWQIKGVADYDGDGKADILWRNFSTGENLVWLLNGSTHTTMRLNSVTDFNWQVASTTDYNGDGKADILWRNFSTGENHIWVLNGSSHTTTKLDRVADFNWKIVNTADYNGDGKADILWRNFSTGENHIWVLNGSSHTTTKLQSVTASNWQIAGCADYDGDGKADILWRNFSTGENHIWVLNGSSHTTTKLQSVTNFDWQVEGTADYDGDGKADILWRNLSTNRSTIWKLNGNAYTAIALDS
ncbi:MAG: DUF4347 domain-containing protein [Myxacorys californica WJT36-NPBG1]|jgi:hypothetical protein|nr:DUF4347 domain-containing protein [Myxacorys californica WJT36-NPBG1]